MYYPRIRYRMMVGKKKSHLKRKNWQALLFTGKKTILSNKTKTEFNFSFTNVTLPIYFLILNWAQWRFYLSTSMFCGKKNNNKKLKPKVFWEVPETNKKPKTLLLFWTVNNFSSFPLHTHIYAWEFHLEKLPYLFFNSINHRPLCPWGCLPR